MEALDLFGGKDLILNGMEVLIAEKMKEMDTEELQSLKDMFGLDFFDIPHMTYNKFSELSGILNISILKILGKPTFSTPKIQEYWEKQIEESPMLVVGHPEQKISFDLYVSLRAIEELNQ